MTRLDKNMMRWPWALALVVMASNAQACTVAVDVGHGPERGGATSARGKAEYTFNQALARRVAGALKAEGVAPVLINANGETPGLRARTARATAAGADLFLSIHHDSVQPHYLKTWTVNGVQRRYSDTFSGYSVFYSDKNPDRAASRALAEAVGGALRQAGFRPSLHHAEPIPGENRPLVVPTKGVYRFDDLIVLKSAAMPAVLLEAGIILNRQDEVRLSKPATRTRLAEAVARAVKGQCPP